MFIPGFYHSTESLSLLYSTVNHQWSKVKAKVVVIWSQFCKRKPE